MLSDNKNITYLKSFIFVINFIRNKTHRYSLFNHDAVGSVVPQTTGEYNYRQQAADELKRIKKGDSYLLSPHTLNTGEEKNVVSLISKNKSEKLLSRSF